MRIPSMCLGLLAAMTFLALPLAAGPLVDKATEAERLLEGGDHGAALARMDEAMALVWAASPLVVKKALYVDGATGYGLYRERQRGHVFSPDEKHLVYIEPVGFGYGTTDGGTLSIGFDIDVRISTTDGKVVFGKQDLASLSSAVRYRNREFYLNVTLSFTGLPVGEYVMDLRLRDQNSEKLTVIQLPLTVAEG